MRLNRSKNAIRNTAYGIINKVVAIILPFLVRTVFIRTLGAEYLGLNSLFSSILTVLNLTDLGFSTAIVFSMYEPIANDEHEVIDALLLYYKKIYRYVGTIILVLGLALIPFLPRLIHGSYPSEINLTFVYIIYLVNTVSGYFLFAYLGSLISAFQREDLISKVNTVVSVLMYTAQIVVLLTVKNYYAYVILLPVFTILNNLRTAVVAKKMFPQYSPKGEISEELRDDIREKVSGLMVSKICTVSRNTFDSIFISMFLGLYETTIYGNYYYIMNSLFALMIVVINSITAGVGNSVSMESVEKNYHDMNCMEFAYMWISGWFTVCLLCLYQPFMELWVGEKMMFPMAVVILLCAYFYVENIGNVRSVYVQAAGLWWERRYCAITEAVANLALNYILGKYFGVYGIVAATLITLITINFFYGSYIVFKCYFGLPKLKEHFGAHLYYAAVTLVIGVISYALCYKIKMGILGFIIKMLICTVVPNALYLLFYQRSGRFQNSLVWFTSKFQKITIFKKG